MITSLLAPTLNGENEDDVDFGGGGTSASLYEDFDEENEIVIPIRQHTRPVQTSAVQHASLVQHNKKMRKKSRDQLMKRTLTMGFHHNHLSPLPSSWEYPKQMTLIQLINMWLLGSLKDNIPPLKTLSAHLVCHFDKKGRSLSMMKQGNLFIYAHDFNCLASSLCI